MPAYQRRLIDDELDALLPALPAVSVEGPKGVGKTSTAAQRSGQIIALDDPATAQAFQAAVDPFATLVAGSILVDEWQRLPQSWDVIRRAVDAGAPPGRFLLTGSATPPDVARHSGAGRIVTLRMRPLSLAERGIAGATVSLNNVLTNRTPTVIAGTSTLGLADYVREIVGSGFPGIRNLPPRAQRAQLDGYLDRVVEREFAELGVTVRRPQTLREWLRAYAAATGTTASYTSILDAASPGQTDKPARKTTTVYRDVLTQLWLLDPVPAWLPIGKEFTRLGSAPKHFLADPALACRLLGLTAEDLVRGVAGTGPGPQSETLLGRLFEALVALCLQVYSQHNEAELGHFRTRNGDHEVDFMVHRGTSAAVAIEVKLARAVSDGDVKHLLWLKNQMGNDLTDMVVITTGDTAYRRADGVAVVPLGLLGP